MRHLPLAVALSLAAIPAQEAFQAKQFLPNEYQNVVRVDLKAMRDAGIWEELETGLLKVILGQMEQEAGYRLTALDRLTMVMEPGRPVNGVESPQRQVLIFEGNADLGVPDRVARNQTYTDESIGIYDVKRREAYGDELFLRPRPEVQIYGATDLLRPMLEGRPSAGLPCPDIMSLMSSRSGDLVYFIVHAADPTLNAKVVPTLFPDSKWPEGDGLQFMLFRVHTAGDPEDPNIGVEVVLRHSKEGEGLRVSEKAVAGWIERLDKIPQLRLVAPLLKEAVIGRDRTDLTIRLDLGTGRTAAGRLTMLAMPMMMLGTTADAAPVPAAAAQEVEEPPPPPPEPAKKKG